MAHGELIEIARIVLHAALQAVRNDGVVEVELPALQPDADAVVVQRGVEDRGRSASDAQGLVGPRDDAVLERQGGVVSEDAHADFE